MAKPNQSGQPSRSTAIVNQAVKIYTEQGSKQSIEFLKTSESEFPDDINIKFQLGKYLIKHNQPKEGIERLESILKEHEGHLGALLELGHFYLKPGNVMKASVYFHKAVFLYPKDSNVQRSFGSLYQRKGDLQLAVEHYRNGLQLQLKNQVLRDDPPPKDDFKTEVAEKLLWDTLALMCKHGIHMFAAWGSLLALVREGHLFPHDKDIDTCLPYSEMERAIKVLKNNGWVEIYGSFGYISPRAFLNKESGITMDISGYVVDSDTGKSITGTWFPGIPKDWNMINIFDQLTLEKVDTQDNNSVWAVKNPEAWLERVYGQEWRVPDKDFDTMVRAKNINGFPLMVKCFAYSRIHQFWQEGNFRRAKALAKSTLEREPNDVLIKKVIAKLSH